MKTDEGISLNDVHEMEERRIDMLNEAGIDEDSVLDKARKDINNWQNYFNENITRGKDDMNFTLRDQWSALEKSEFNRLFKPPMTFNKTYDSVKKISGEQRKNKPDLIVRSLNGMASQEDLDLRAGIIRNISYNSQSDLVYQNASDNALLSGYGAFKIDIEYESPTSFYSVLRAKLLKDNTLLAFDPCSDLPHKGDGNFCSNLHAFNKDEFYARTPYVSNAQSFTDPRTLLDFTWETRDTIIVADYFVKEWYPTIIYKLSNGLSVTKEQWEDMQKTFKFQKDLAKDSAIVGDIILKEIPKIVMERKGQNYKIMQYQMIQDKIIDFREWPSKYLPIIFLDGDSHFIEGRQYTRSFVHDARDAQRFLNYVNSEIAAEIKNRRREQWIGTPDNILGYEQFWRNPELQNGILIAKPDNKTGAMPQKLPPWDLSPALLQNSQRATMDIREILGFSESNQTDSRDISGIAKRERKLEGSMSSYVYFDNRDRAIEQAGRVYLDLLPAVYGNDERTIMVTKKNGKIEPIIINQRMPDGSIKNELTPGDFDIEIDTGPSFAVQKEVALEFLQQTIQAYPQAFPLIADLWAQNLDVQFMPQMADRFKTLVPPDVLAKEDGKPLPPQPPNPQEQMMQAQLQLQTQQLQDRAEELRIRQEKHELEKIRLILDAKKLQTDSGISKSEKAIDWHKAELDYSARIASIVANLEKAS